MKTFASRFGVARSEAGLSSSSLWLWLGAGAVCAVALFGLTYWVSPLLQPEPELLPNPLPLGSAALISGPTPCGSETCYKIELTCPEVSRPERVLLQVGQPAGSTERGTILFASGWIGTFLWEQRGVEARRVITELQAAGFRTVQLHWTNNWYGGAPGQAEGYARLACRPATAARWVFDNLHQQNPDTAFCAVGHSNGAAQVSYMLTHYGLANQFSAVVLENGPNFARIDQGCLHTLLNRSLRYPQDSAQDVDLGFGFANDGTGPCGSHNAAFRRQFQEASIAFRGQQYVYPKTMVWFLFGGQDDTPTSAQGRIFYQRLLKANTPLLGMDVVPDAPHELVSVPAGADALRDVLLKECWPR